MINSSVKNPVILEWLCKNETNRDIQLDYSDNPQRKFYISVPENIQRFVKDRTSYGINEYIGESSINQNACSAKQNSNERVHANSGDANRPSISGKEYSKTANGTQRNSVLGVIGGESLTKKEQSVTSLVDSTQRFVQNDPEGLWNTFQTHGYVYLRDVVDRDDVLRARRRLVRSLVRLGHVDADSERTLSAHGWTVDCSEGVVIAGADDCANNQHNQAEIKQEWKKICAEPTLAGLRRSDGVRKALSMLSRGKSAVEGARSIPYLFDNHNSWLRVKGPKEFTPVHSDVFYMRSTDMFKGSKFTYVNDRLQPLRDSGDAFCSVCGREGGGGGQGEDGDCLLRCDECFAHTHVGCVRPPVEDVPPEDRPWYCSACTPGHALGTCWLPLGDVEVDDGVLALLPGRDRTLPRFFSPAGGAQIPASYTAKCHHKGWVWHAGDMRAGDILLFDCHLIHATTTNRGQGFRLSLDFRWDLAPQRRGARSQTDMSRYVLANASPVADGVAEGAEDTTGAIRPQKRRKTG